MRIALAELAPRPRDVAANVARLETVVGAAPAEMVVFPELYLSGYKIGDAFHRVALDRRTLETAPAARAARATRRWVLVGAPLRSAARPGEVENAALLFAPDGRVHVQGKRFLPTYGPFEEGSIFSPSPMSEPIDLGAARAGLSICYDAFFPEVGRELALLGATLLLTISAAPITSRRLFEKVLPARAVENALPLVYVNRVGVEDGIVFGGGSGAWDARGEPIPLADVPVEGLGSEESLRVAEVDLEDAGRWRPFRPVLRDLAGARAGAADRAPPVPWTAAHLATRTSDL